jgi:hypothetical protein
MRMNKTIRDQMMMMMMMVIIMIMMIVMIHDEKECFRYDDVDLDEVGK